MKNRALEIVTILVCLINGYAYGQTYRYDLEGVEKEWHRIELTDEVLANAEDSYFRDLKILQINGYDTIEVPYYREQIKSEDKTVSKPFSTLNNSYIEGEGQYITFNVGKDILVNEFQVYLDQSNFDLNLKLEGSQNNRRWYEIVKDYRIVSINNDLVSYQFNTLRIPDSKYEYYRLFIPADKETAAFDRIYLRERVTNENPKITYQANIVKTEEDKEKKTTTVYFDIKNKLPISGMKIDVSSDKDYYRKFALEYLADTFTTETGFHESYEHGTSGYLSSFEENAFAGNWSSKLCRKFRLVIQNRDDQPISIKGVELDRYRHTYIARFEGTGRYELVHGSTYNKPHYDLKSFKDQVPEDLATIKPSNPRKFVKEKVSVDPLFKKKSWLWMVLFPIMGLLIWFAFQMLKEKEVGEEHF